jgi:hypothetical protein
MHLDPVPPPPQNWIWWMLKLIYKQVKQLYTFPTLYSQSFQCISRNVNTSWSSDEIPWSPKGFMEEFDHVPTSIYIPVDTLKWCFTYLHLWSILGINTLTVRIETNIDFLGLVCVIYKSSEKFITFIIYIHVITTAASNCRLNDFIGTTDVWIFINKALNESLQWYIYPLSRGWNFPGKLIQLLAHGLLISQNLLAKLVKCKIWKIATAFPVQYIEIFPPTFMKLSNNSTHFVVCTEICINHADASQS